MDYQLLSPQEELEEQFPYRRVWRTLFLELGALGAIVLAIWGLTTFGLLADTYSQTIGLPLAAIPIALFYVFSVRREATVIEPREGLLSVLILSMIIANGVAVPVFDLLITPEIWLPEAGFFSRIFGYAFTVGILSEFLKYAVVRYTVWPLNFRTRLDGVAFSVAAGLGFATLLNLRFILLNEPTLSAAAIRILTNVYTHVAIGAVMGYFLGELAVAEPRAYWLPLGLFIAAMLGGLHNAFRSIAIVSGLGDRAIGGLLFAMGLTGFILASLAFLIESADQRMADQQGLRRIR